MPGKQNTLPVLVGALQSAIERLQEQEELAPNDPVLLEIKSSILLTIARRETESRPEMAACIPEYSSKDQSPDDAGRFRCPDGGQDAAQTLRAVEPAAA